jgi:hypothetical protein
MDFYPCHGYRSVDLLLLGFVGEWEKAVLRGSLFLLHMCASVKQAANIFLG